MYQKATTTRTPLLARAAVDTPNTEPLTGATLLDTPSLDLLALIHEPISTTPTPVKTTFFPFVRYHHHQQQQYQAWHTHYEPSNPYRDLTLTLSTPQQQQKYISFRPPSPCGYTRPIGRFAPPRFSTRLRTLAAAKRVRLIPQRFRQQPPHHFGEKAAAHAHRQWGVVAVECGRDGRVDADSPYVADTALGRAGVLFSTLVIVVIMVAALGFVLAQLDPEKPRH